MYIYKKVELFLQMLTVRQRSNIDTLNILNNARMGVKYSRILADYNISPYKVKKIEKIFKDCHTVQDIKNKCIQLENEKQKKKDSRLKKAMDHSAHYIKYRDYYKNYYASKRRANIK